VVKEVVCLLLILRSGFLILDGRFSMLAWRKLFEGPAGGSRTDIIKLLFLGPDFGDFVFDYLRDGSATASS
jgi:hypothetical protein